MISTSEFKRGLWIEVDGDPWLITDVSKHSPTARGASMIIKVKMRNGKNGSFQDKSFRGGDKVGVPNVEERTVQYLYKDGQGYHFMDQESYEQFSLNAEELGDAVLHYMTDDLELTAMLLDERVIGVTPPPHVELKVTECPPPTKGATGQTKTAILETGLAIQVPAYLEQGEVVRVDTRDARFIQRVKG